MMEKSIANTIENEREEFILEDELDGNESCDEDDESEGIDWRASDIKKQKLYAYLKDLYERESLPLLEGNGLYETVTIERIEELYPRIAVDLRKYFTGLTFGGTDLDDRYLTAFLRLFARKQYDSLEKEIQNKNIKLIHSLSWLFEVSLKKIKFFPQNDARNVVFYLEEFRKFSLTAKVIKNRDELLNGDVIYNGQIIVNHDLPVNYVFGVSRDGYSSLTNGPYCKEVGWPVFVIGCSTGIRIDKIMQKATYTAECSSMEKWLNLLRNTEYKFPSSHYIPVNGKRQEVEGIGRAFLENLESQYVNWLLKNPDEINNYFKPDKRSSSNIMLSKLSTNMRRKVVERVKELMISIISARYTDKGFALQNSYDNSGLKWLGKEYHFPDLSGYLGHPIRKFFASASIEQLTTFDWPLVEVKRGQLVEVLYPDIIEDVEMSDEVFYQYEQISLF